MTEAKNCVPAGNAAKNCAPSPENAVNDCALAKNAQKTAKNGPRKQKKRVRVALVTPEMPVSDLLKRTYALCDRVPPGVPIGFIAEGAGVGRAWLTKFMARAVVDPGVNKVCAVHNYLKRSFEKSDWRRLEEKKTKGVGSE